MQAYEFLRLNAAAAASADRFCVSFDEGDPDDPFSIVLTYDGRFPQPWSRFEITRKIAGITVVDNAEPDPVYSAVSDEGDVYTLTGTEIHADRIEGAGLYSDDAVGHGQLSGILKGDDAVWVYGFGGQIYRGTEGQWQQIMPVGDDASRQFIGAAEAGGDGTTWFCGMVTPVMLVEGYKPDPELRAKLAQASRDNDVEKAMELMDELRRQKTGGAELVQTPLLLRYANGKLTRFDIDSDELYAFMAIHVESPNRIWVTSTSGEILFGNAETGFQPVPHAGQLKSDGISSIARFGDRFIMAGSTGLFGFDGHVLSRIKPRLNSPKINRNIPIPLRVQSVGDILFYFDYKHGICRWDGKAWDWIDIPDALLEREFNGLK